MQKQSREQHGWHHFGRCSCSIFLNYSSLQLELLSLSIAVLKQTQSKY